METLKFKNLPIAVAELIKGQSELKILLVNKVKLQPKPDNLLNIEKVIELTDLAVPILCVSCQINEAFYYKKGNRLYFFKPHIIKSCSNKKQKKGKISASLLKIFWRWIIIISKYLIQMYLLTIN